MPELLPLRPSGLYRSAFGCPGSRRLEVQAPPGPSSRYAEEGTAAHRCGELILSGEADYWSLLGEMVEGVRVTPSMIGPVSIYVDHCRRVTGDGEAQIEATTQLPFLGVGVSGTCDHEARPSLALLAITDYKHGSGLYVHHIGNSQLYAYACGALGRSRAERKPDPKAVDIHLVQPRFEGAAAIRSERVTVDALDIWRYKTLPAAIAETENPEAPLIAGEWCRYCRVRSACLTFMQADSPLKGGRFARKKMQLQGAEDTEISWLQPPKEET